MKLDIQLFGPLADLLGQRRLHLELQEEHGMCARRVLQHIAELHPRLAPALGAFRLAVNCELAQPDDVVSATDELALIGMVSGG
jgi:molybdopterin converting factor small subunit